MITSKKYLEVTEVKIIGKFRLELSFNDGAQKRVDLSKLIKSPPPVFEPLIHEDAFNKVNINPVGGISWECGADLSAEFLYNY